MRTADQIISAALKTQSSAVLFLLVQEAVELAKFAQSKEELSRVREKKLTEQVQRQTALIDNLEKTLWSKK